MRHSIDNLPGNLDNDGIAAVKWWCAELGSMIALFAGLLGG
jgi:hypothetical protein